MPKIANINNKQMNNKSSVKPKDSIKAKMILMFMVAMVLITAICLIISDVKNTKYFGKVISNYMTDMVNSAGDDLDRQYARVGSASALNQFNLKKIFLDRKIAGMDSSYYYVVSPDGTMLFHPEDDKVGKPVENAIIKEVVAELQAGKGPHGQFVTYQYKGKTKYCAYYIPSNRAWILVLTADKSDAMSGIKSTEVTAITTSIIVGIIMLFLFTFLINRLMAPITTTASVLGRIAGLDFTKGKEEKALAARKDEFGLSGRAIINLEDSLSGTIKDIKDQSTILLTSSNTILSSAANMSSTTNQVDSAVEEIAKGATSQAEETANANDAVKQIGQMITDTTEEVNNLKSAASDMKKAHDDAVNTLHELGEVNERTKASIQTISEQTKATNESTQKIREVTALISDIAEETNLLSLNASIEAARAGEAGRGFAVVASQIQKLADQSDNSAKQIEKIIDVLLTESKKSVSTMEDVKEVIDQQSKDVDKTGEAFKAVSAGIDRSEEGINRISEKMSMMEVQRASVVNTVESLSAIAEENAASTEESSASVSTISGLANDMQQHSNDLKGIANTLDQNMSKFKY